MRVAIGKKESHRVDTAGVFFPRVGFWEMNNCNLGVTASC